MESRITKAAEKHAAGYNCAQAVFCTYCDQFGITEADAYRMSEAFGLGMGTQRTCGALTGALMLAGLKNSGGTELPGATKRTTYQLAQQLTQTFQEKVGATDCKDIKTVPALCSCADCIAHACQMVEEQLL